MWCAVRPDSYRDHGDSRNENLKVHFKLKVKSENPKLCGASCALLFQFFLRVQLLTFIAQLYIDNQLVEWI